MTDRPSAEAPPARPNAKLARARAISLLVSLLVALLMAEGALRVLKRKVPFQPDPDLIRSLRPDVDADIFTYESDANWNGERAPRPPVHFAGKSRTNNIGFRMAEDVGPKAADERRVLLLGDSFTEADQVSGDLRFSYLLNKRLEKETAGGPEHWRLLNGGIQNGSPVQYILQLRRWLDSVKPDVVIIALAPNDPTDDALFERTYGFDFDAQRIPIAPRSRLQLTLLQDSYMFRYFQVFSQHFPSLGATFFPPASPETALTTNNEMLCTNTPEAFAAFRRLTGKYLEELKRMTEAKGARFGVFLIHYMWSFADEPYDESYWPNTSKELDIDRCVKTGVQGYNAFVEGWLRDAGMAFKNPYAAILRAKAENPKRKLWNYVDYHFSPAGHRVMADEMSAFVSELGGPRVGR